MKKPVNFETIGHSRYKILGCNFELRVGGLENDNNGKGDYTRVWLITDGVDGDTFGNQVGRVFYFDFYWDKNQCRVFAPVWGNGDDGPFLEDYTIHPMHFKTPTEFKTFLAWIVESEMNKWNLHDSEKIEPGFTSLSILVKSDTSDTEYAVEYVRNIWSCTCKGFVYSKALPQTCKHILKTIKQ